MSDDERSYVPCRDSASDPAAADHNNEVERAYQQGREDAAKAIEASDSGEWIGATGKTADGDDISAFKAWRHYRQDHYARLARGADSDG